MRCASTSTEKKETEIMKQKHKYNNTLSTLNGDKQKCHLVECAMNVICLTNQTKYKNQIECVFMCLSAFVYSFYFVYCFEIFAAIKQCMSFSPHVMQ